MMMHDRDKWLVWDKQESVRVVKFTTVIRTYIQLNVIFREGHFLTVLLPNALPLTGWCEEVSLTMPEPSCWSRPEPCEPPKTADGRLDLMLCMLLLSRKGTLLLVLGIEPPYKRDRVGRPTSKRGWRKTALAGVLNRQCDARLATSIE